MSFSFCVVSSTFVIKRRPKNRGTEETAALRKANQQKEMKVSSSVLALFGVASSALAFNVQPSVVPSTTNVLASKSSSALHMAESDMEGFAQSASSEFETLGLQARPGRSLKVAIAGGGVGGLTTALCMLKKGFDVTVYEKTEAFQRFGGPIQFASNALSVLKEIDDVLFDRVMEKFTFTGTRTCGIKDGMYHVSAQKYEVETSEMLFSLS